MARLALLLALLLPAPGCFVFDELDKGQAIMDQHSPKKNAEAEPAPAVRRRGSAPEDEGLLAGMQGWFEEKKTLAQPTRPPPDPDDVPITCRIQGRTQFLRKSDCALRGGTIL